MSEQDLVGFRNGVWGDSARTYVIGNSNSKEKKNIDYMLDVIENQIFFNILSEIKIYNRFSDITKIMKRIALTTTFNLKDLYSDR